MGLASNLRAHEYRKKRLYRVVWTFSILTIAAFVFSFLISNLLITRQQQSLLYQEKMRSVRITLSQFVNNAAVPLAQNDVLTLNTLLKEATSSISGLLYVAIVDQKNVIRAHTDPAKIGKIFEESLNGGKRSRDADISTATYILPTGERVLELSRPVMFTKKNLGSVYLAISRNVINGEINKQISASVRSMFYLGIALLMLLVGAAFFLCMPLKRELTAEGEALQLASEQPCESQAGGKNGVPCTSDLVEGEPANLLNPYREEITRTQVTVLFAGIKGFKAYTEARDPQEVLDDLNQYLSVATDCIVAYGGYVDKFIGDAVIAVFGNTPLWADHSERAVSAAVAIQEALQNAAGNGNPLLSKVGIGISSGVVLSGHIGTEEKKAFTFIGESFKVAYSLNVMAGPGEIIMSKDVYQSVEQNVSVEPLAPREMAQRTEAWENFRLIKLIERKDYSRGLSR
ncbi:MAG TPA: adenylate/guanylate cyclase domain-containing protein [Syntrophorhabdales bacterium]|nr:adenylate/guanylate cyclase domain-containing protein [Syntrophorhabdales bacterium]